MLENIGAEFYWKRIYNIVNELAVLLLDHTQLMTKVKLVTTIEAYG